MLNALGISEWVAAAVMTWLAVQVPLGILVGFCLRRTNVLSMPEFAEILSVAEEPGGQWQVLVQPRPVPATVLR